MKSLKIGSGNQYMHRESADYRKAVRRKFHAYHTFVMAGIIAQGLLHYLSSEHAEVVWRSFGSWLRTIRKGLAPSEFVVATALRHSLSEFLLVTPEEQKLAKFIRERQDPDRFDVFRMASWWNSVLLSTLTLTDITTGWTECLPLLRKSAGDVIIGLKLAQELLPFPLLGVDTALLNKSKFDQFQRH